MSILMSSLKANQSETFRSILCGIMSNVFTSGSAVTTKRSSRNPYLPGVTTDKASDWKKTSSSTCTSVPPPVETPASSLLMKLEWRVSGRTIKESLFNTTLIKTLLIVFCFFLWKCIVHYKIFKVSDLAFMSQIREIDTRTERPAGSSALKLSLVKEQSQCAPVTPFRRGTGFFRVRGCSPCPAAIRSPGTC